MTIEDLGKIIMGVAIFYFIAFGLFKVFEALFALYPNDPNVYFFLILIVGLIIYSLGKIFDL